VLLRFLIGVAATSFVGLLSRRLVLVRNLVGRFTESHDGRRTAFHEISHCVSQVLFVCSATKVAAREARGDQPCCALILGDEFDA
jgi:hypothetical protein